MKKILILANNHIGLYKFRKELIQAFINEGYKIYVSLPYGDKIEKLEKMGCKFIETDINRRSANPFEDIKLFFKYLKILNYIEPDVVFTYTVKPNIYGGIACRLKNIPYICNVTGLGSGYLNGGIIQKIVILLSRLSFKGADTVFFQNTGDMALLVKCNVVKGNNKLLPGSGVNLSDYKLLEYPNEDDAIIFNFIGRIMKDKGIDEYLKAAKIIKQKHPNVIFNVIGMIDQERYKDILRAYEEENIIKYHAFQDDIRPFIEKSSCIINPSYTEGMSNILLESAASGRPIIASNIFGCKEIIDEGVNGYTFEVKDVDNLCHKIEKFIDLKYSHKVTMGINGRKKVEKEFDRQIVIDLYLKEINKIKFADKL